jgi:hypothetical protein
LEAKTEAKALGGDKNQKEGRPLSYYTEVYQKLDPREIARRCALPFDAGAFTLRLMGTEYRGTFPDFELWDPAGRPSAAGYEKILILRYLCEGKYLAPQGKQLSYHEIPWGPVYYRNFEGRCIKRLARTFGNDLPRFRHIMETSPGLRAEPLGRGDAGDRAGYRAGYRFEFISGLYMGFLLWAGDEEFPPSAQILFDDNFVFAFTAEDLAVAGEAAIERLKQGGLKTR